MNTKRIEKIKETIQANQQNETATITDGKILIFGDLHLSQVYQGTHKNYQENCARVMKQIITHTKNQGNVGAVIFLGDVFGVKEQVLKVQDFFLASYEFFGELNQLTNGNVYSVKGNHDFSDFSTFDFFNAIGLIKNPKYIDYIPQGSHEARFHLVNYGLENEELEKGPKGASQVVLAHNDFQIPDKTAWYGGKSLELGAMKNMHGIDLVISGHIHTPTPGILTTTLSNGEEIGLFYPGCPTRVSERIEEVFWLFFEFDGQSTQFEAPGFGLWSVEEEFHPKDEETQEEDDPNGQRKQELKTVLDELRTSRISGHDLIEQIERIPNASLEAKTLAKQFLGKVLNK